MRPETALQDKHLSCVAAEMGPDVLGPPGMVEWMREVLLATIQRRAPAFPRYYDADKT